VNIPGFTAEYSIAARQPFGGSVSWNRSWHLNPAISPAVMNTGTEHGCFNICGGDPDCMGDCTNALGGDGSGNGGGGGGLHCTPGCGSCQQIRGQWQKACVNATCGVHYAACRP
jgi:hypothetical protein